MKQFNCDIYPVITERFCKNGSSVETLKRAVDGGARAVQLREKEYPKGKILEMARRCREITFAAGALLIINDHVDIALISGADGVHLGQDDISCRDARSIAPDLIIGVSTHNLGEAFAAIEAGADYINIGPIFRTDTKNTVVGPLGTGAIAEVSARVSAPFTVMGGIKERHLPGLIESGARRVAMVTEITMSDDVRGTVERLRRYFRP